MSLHYDKARLDRLLEDFCLLTGISAAVLDVGGQTLASYSGKTPLLCREIQNSPCGHEKCACSDRDLIALCQKTKKPARHFCHAGVMDAVIPILNANRLIGYILLGRMRVLAFEEVHTRLSWLPHADEALQTMYEELPTYEERQLQGLFELATVLVSFLLTEHIVHAEDDAFVRLVESHIDAHLSEALSVDRLCRAFGMSKSSLYERFHLVFGQTVGEYILQRRMEKAYALVCESTLSMSDIAEQVGIRDYSYLSRLFKKKYACAPCTLRKRMKSTPNR